MFLEEAHRVVMEVIYATHMQDFRLEDLLRAIISSNFPAGVGGEEVSFSYSSWTTMGTVTVQLRTCQNCIFMKTK